MNKYFLFVLVFLLIGILGWKFLNTPVKQPEIEPQVVAQNIKDCGSDISREGNNQNNIDRECFLEAYESCVPAKVYREVYPPENKVIKTTVVIEGIEDDKCRVRVQVEDKFTIPENDIYYCYSAERMPTDEIYNNGAVKLSSCRSEDQAKKEYIL